MMLSQVRYVYLVCGEFAARYMCTSIERVAGTTAKDVHDQKSAYYKQMAANQSEYNEKPAGWDSAKPYSEVPGISFIKFLQLSCSKVLNVRVQYTYSRFDFNILNLITEME